LKVYTNINCKKH